MKKKNFAGGAVILALAIGISKVLSAVFKIPLDRIFLHADGMAVFNGAYNIYSFFFTLATAGLPLAVSKLIASSKDAKERGEAFFTALIFSEGVLLISAIVIFFSADQISRFTGIDGSSSSIRVMATALIFLGFTAAFRGLFQGELIMLPPSLSQVFDAFGRLIVGFAGAYLFFGSGIYKASTAAMTGVFAGAALSAFTLFLFWRRGFKALPLSFSPEKLKYLLIIAAPITLTATMHPVFNLIDTLSVVQCLENAGFSASNEAFGALTRASTLYTLPVSIAAAVSASVLPSIALSAQKGDRAGESRDASLSLRMVLFISAPCAAGFIALSGDILSLLYDSAIYSAALWAIALSAPFAALSAAIAAILQGKGKIISSSICVGTAFAAKIILNIFLIPLFSVTGAAAATSLAYILCTLMLLILLLRGGISLNIQNVFAKPAICASVCGAGAYFSAKVLPTPLAILIAAIIYLPMVFITKFMTFDEIKYALGKDEKIEQKA